ncbi:adenylate kinase-domain-containing protein [Lasiosphaeria hispida]|uniref:Adenylate kinase-domain-containing protein n=1 Tax=Lasiosphaeria hispida TaxID=260671 RepID=A0AAJ0HTT3_9PEZI|nr:adenylate kinase-domain-containing protein [Lasiosphaeria hispida]
MNLIFVLGKSTLCKQLSEAYGLAHISVGDLIRGHAKKGLADIDLAGYIQQSELLPTEVIIAFVKDRLRDESGRPNRPILLDGFPRNLEQAQKFEEASEHPKLVLLFDCLEEIAKDGVVARSSRPTDTAEGFDKRYKEYDALSPPIVARYRSQNKLVTFNTSSWSGGLYQALDEELHRSSEWLKMLASRPRW